MVAGLVSSITPVYNSERFLAQTVRAIIQQTYKNIEIILVDDCSSDHSRNIIETFAKEHSNIRYIFLPRNEGAAVARNYALNAVNGQYVAFCDSDDIWKPEKIEKEIRWMQKRDADFVFTAIEMIDENGTVIKEKRNVREYVDYNYLLKNTMIATSSVLLDIGRIGTLQMPNIHSGQDYATWLMLLRNGRIAYGLDEALVQYRKRGNSLSSNKFANPKKVWRIQTELEHISPFNALLNVGFYAWNGVKKHFC